MMSQPPRPSERIAKLLARAGVASRREIERYIADGRIALNGETLTTPATLLHSLAGVTVDGNPVAAPAPARLFAFHKPPGLLTTERDPAGRRTIYDALPVELPRVVPVGRLDLNTEGLLLLTTDGGLKRQLELPRSGVERSYRARAYGEISQAQLEDLMDGIEIEGVRYGSIDANLERRTGANVWIELTLTEGKNREVRRVLEHLGLQVSRLIRTRYGPFLLDDLAPGAVVEIRQHDLVAFRKELALPPERRQAIQPEPIVPAVNRAERRAEAVKEREEAAPPPERPRARAATKPVREGPRRAGDARPSRPRAKPAKAVEHSRARRPGQPGARPRSASPDGSDRARPERASTEARPLRTDGGPSARAVAVGHRIRSDRPDRSSAEGRPPRSASNQSRTRRGDATDHPRAGAANPRVRSDRPERPSVETRPARPASDRSWTPRTDANEGPQTDRPDRDGGDRRRPRAGTTRPRTQADPAARPPGFKGKPAPRAGDLVDRPRSARPPTSGKPRPGKPRRPGPARPR